jgi:hypothetical protein
MLVLGSTFNWSCLLLNCRIGAMGKVLTCGGGPPGLPLLVVKPRWKLGLPESWALVMSSEGVMSRRVSRLILNLASLASMRTPILNLLIPYMVLS